MLANFSHFSQAFYRHLVCQNRTIIKKVRAARVTPLPVIHVEILSVITVASEPIIFKMKSYFMLAVNPLVIQLPRSKHGASVIVYRSSMSKGICTLFQLMCSFIIHVWAFQCLELRYRPTPILIVLFCKCGHHTEKWVKNTCNFHQTIAEVYTGRDTLSPMPFLLM